MAEPALTDAHDTSLVGDELTRISINYKWRRYVVDLLAPLCGSDFWSGTEADVKTARNNASRLLEDLYTPMTLSRYGIQLRAIQDFNVLAGISAFLPFADPNTVAGCYDFGGFWDPLFPDKVTVPVGAGGFYTFSLNIHFTASAAGNKQAIIRHASTNRRLAGEAYSDTASQKLSLSGEAELADGDVLDILLTSLVDVTVVGSALAFPIFTLHKIG